MRVQRSHLPLAGRFGVHVHASLRQSASEGCRIPKQTGRQRPATVPAAGEQHPARGGDLAARFGSEDVYAECQRFPSRSAQGRVPRAGGVLLQSGLVAGREREERLLAVGQRGSSVAGHFAPVIADRDFQGSSGGGE